MVRKRFCQGETSESGSRTSELSFKVLLGSRVLLPGRAGQSRLPAPSGGGRRQERSRSIPLIVRKSYGGAVGELAGVCTVKRVEPVLGFGTAPGGRGHAERVRVVRWFCCHAGGAMGES